MPLIDIASPNLATPALGVTANEQAQAEADQPTNSQIWGAAFRQNNTIGSGVANKEVGMSTDAGQGPYMDPNWHTWNSLQGTKYADRWDDFQGIFNKQDFEARKAQVDLEDNDRKTMAQSGLMGTVAGITAGITDLPSLIPVAGELNGARTAANVGKAFVRGAGSVGAGVAVQEAALQGSQATRTAGESATNIGASMLLGGIIGSGAHILLPGERQAAGAAVDRLRNDPLQSVAAGPQSAGAAATQNLTRADLSVDGKAAGAIVDKTAWLNPNLRLNTSASTNSRLIGQQLAENTIYQTMHAEGGTVGPAVETLMKEAMHGRLADAVQSHNDLWSAARKSNVQMTRDEFDEEVGRAMRRGDTGSNDYVSQAAKTWRDKVVEPFKKEAIENGQLPADVSVETADSYFTRMWNSTRLNAEEGRFKQITSDYYNGALTKEFAADVARLQGRHGKLDQEAADLKLNPDQRTQAVQDIEAKQQQLYGNNPDHVDLADKLNDLRQQVAAANERGDKATSTQLKEAAQNLRKQAGDKFKAFEAERASLNARRRNVELGYSAMSDRRDTIMGQLADLNESNLRSMTRLIQKGQKFQQDLQRVSPEVVADRVSQLRESFAGEAAKAERQAEKFKTQLDKLEKAKAEGKDVGAAGADLLDKQAKAEQARADRLNAIAARLETAERLDPQAMADELQNGVAKLVDEVSNVSLGRGERAQRLQEKLSTLDPAKVDERLKVIDEMKRDLQRRHMEKWDIERGAEGTHLPVGQQDFSQYTSDIANSIFDTLTGRGFDHNIPEGIVPATRGPMKERTFNIPDHLVEDFLNSNVRHVMENYARKMAADVELARKFGSADLKEPLTKIQNEYLGLRQSVQAAGSVDEIRAIIGKDQSMVASVFEKLKDPSVDGVRAKALKALEKGEKSDMEDVQAMRDLLRGTYKKANINNVWGRSARGLLAFNYMTRLGHVVLANISEVYRPAMVYGLANYMKEGIAPLMTSAGRAAAGLAVSEAKLAGQVVERVLQHRVMSFAEMGDPYAGGNAIERLLQNGTRAASRFNGLSMWTDGMKAVSSILSQNRIVNLLRDGSDVRTLAYLGLDNAMRDRVGQQVAQFAEKREGVWIANTEKWSDPQAVRAYRAAMNKDIDSVIVTKSVGDVPLFANTPTGKLITQFKAFSLSSHQRVLIKGVQESPTRFVSGMVGMTGMGMLATFLRLWGQGRFTGKDEQANPAWWAAEGLDNTGIFSVPMELGNDTEKLTGLNPIKDPVRLAGSKAFGTQTGQGKSSKINNRGTVGQLLGPAVGMGDDLISMLKPFATRIGGEKPNAGQDKAAIDAAIRNTPGYSYMGIREITDNLVKPWLHESLGAKP